MDRPPFSKIPGHGALDGFLREFFIRHLGYARIDNDPDEKNPHSAEAWRLVIPTEGSRPLAISHQASLSSMERRRVSRLYIERVVPHRDREGTRSVEPALYGFTDGLRLVFFSADPSRNRDDRFDLSESTWKFRATQDKVTRLHRERLQFQTRLGKKRPLVEFLFEASALSADDGFKRYVHVARQELMRAVLEDRRALGAVVYHLLESPEARGAEKTQFVGKDHRLKRTLEELHFEVGVRLGDAVAAAVDTLLLRYVVVRFLEAYHPDAMEGLLKSEEVLKRGKGGRKLATTKQMILFGGEVGPVSFSDSELELARMFNDALGVDVSKAKAKSKGADQRQPDLFAFGDEKTVARIVLEEEGKRESRLGGDFYLADLGRAAKAIEAQLLSNPSSRGAKLIQDFLGRTGAPEMAQWDFRYEDLRPQTLQDYYESSLGTAVELSFNQKKKEWEIAVGRSQRQRKELGAFYTDPRLCRLMVERAVRPLFESRLEAMRKAIAAKDVPSAKREFASLVNLSVCDPTMGSAPFLRSAFDYLSEQYLPLCRVLIEAKATLPSFFEDMSKDFPFLAAKGGHMDEDGVGRWEWHILRRMLYGVDLDLKAVCIACQTFALSALKYLKQGERFPSFFNLNLKLGSALVSPVRVADRVELSGTHGKTIAKLIQLRRKAVSLPNSEKAYDELVKLLKEIDSLKNPLLRALVEGRIAPLLGDFTEDLRPFCWEIEFPEVFFEDDGSLKDAPGFDVMIGNPPWESLEVDTDEFFEQFHSGYDALKPASKKNTLREKLLGDARIRKAYDHRCGTIAALVKLVKPEAGFYELQHTVLDGERKRSEYATYKMMLERCLDLTRRSGRLSLVVPLGLTGDLGSFLLRQRIFNTCDLPYVRGFLKSSGIFPGVVQAFCIFWLVPGGETQEIGCLTGLASIDELIARDDSAIPCPVDLIKRMAPLSWSIPSIVDRKTVDVLTKLYAYPVLNEKTASGWNVEVSYAELNSSNDVKAGVIRDSAWDLPIWEGKLIGPFERARNAKVGAKSKDFAKRRRADVIDFARVVIRSIAGSDDPRRLIATVLPPRYAIMDSLNYIEPKGLTEETKVFVAACLNSFVLEWRARQLATNNNISGFVIRQLPVPRLVRGNPDFDAVVERATSLLLSDGDLTIILKGLPARRVINKDQRAELRREIDALIAHMYGFDEPEFQFVLDVFSDVEVAERRGVLDQFRRLAKAHGKKVSNARSNPARAVKS